MKLLRSVLATWQAWAIGVAGMLLAHHPMILSGFAYIQNDLGDSRFVNYLLEHGYRFVTFRGGPGGYWSPEFFYPAKNVMAYAEVMLGTVPFYVPWRMVGFAPDTAFQLWLLTLSALNYAAAYTFLRHCLKTSVLGSAMGAFLFAFAASRTNQTMHHQLYPHFFTITAGYALFRLFGAGQPQGSLVTEARVQTERSAAKSKSLSIGRLDAGRRRAWMWWAVFCGSILAQLYASFYLGWYLVLALSVLLALALARRSWREELLLRLRQDWKPIVVATVTSALLLAPLALRYRSAASEVGLRTFQEAWAMLPRLQSWITQGPYSWMYSWLMRFASFRDLPMEHEHRIGIGFLCTATGIAGLYLGRKRPEVLLAGGTALVLAVLCTLFPNDLTLWRGVYEYFPGAKAIRAVARIGLLHLLPIGMGIALVVQWLEERKQTVLAMVGSAVIFFEQGQTTPAYDKAKNRADIDAIVRAIPEGCRAFLFTALQGYQPYWKYHLDAMWAHLESGRATLNGYSGSSPPEWKLGLSNIHRREHDAYVGQVLQEWVSRSGLDQAKVCWLRLPVQDYPLDSDVIDVEMPEAVKAGETFEVRITLRNSGRAAWRGDLGFGLGSELPRDNLRWGITRARLAGQVFPGEQTVVRLKLIAPRNGGTYPIQWRMVQDGVGWFGDATPPREIRVEP